MWTCLPHKYAQLFHFYSLLRNQGPKFRPRHFHATLQCFKIVTNASHLCQCLPVFLQWILKLLVFWLFAGVLKIEFAARYWKILKVGLSPSKKTCVICFIERSLKMMKNAFYFILKALFVHKIFKFLSWLFGHVEKTAWLER